MIVDLSVIPKENIEYFTSYNVNKIKKCCVVGINQWKHRIQSAVVYSSLIVPILITLVKVVLVSNCTVLIGCDDLFTLYYRY